jgi:hypothetical protein
MTLQTKRAQASVTPGDNGEFDLVLSNATIDREGESIPAGSWVQPLPATIPINANHSADVSDIVGSGVPWIDSAGNLRVRGAFASTPLGQKIRTLVNEGHLRSVSVEMLRRKDANSGVVVNELVGGAFVNIPANPTAVVLASKAMEDDTPPEWFLTRLRETLMGETDAMTMVTKAAGGDAAMVTAIHDAAVHLGAQCLAAPPDVDDGSDDGANKALRLLSLRVKALRG